mgnify:FL=1
MRYGMRCDMSRLLCLRTVFVAMALLAVVVIAGGRAELAEAEGNIVCSTNSGGFSATISIGEVRTEPAFFMPGTVVHCDTSEVDGAWLLSGATVTQDPTPTGSSITVVLGSALAEGVPQATIEYTQPSAASRLTIGVLQTHFGELEVPGPGGGEARRAVVNVPPVSGYVGAAGTDHFNSRAANGAGVAVWLGGMSGTVFGSNCGTYGMAGGPEAGPGGSGIAVVFRREGSDPAVCEHERK